MRRLTLSACAFALFFPFGADAAERATARLEVTRAPGAESCADGTRLEELVEEHLGRSVFEIDEDTDVLVRARFEANEPGYRAVLVLSHADKALGERVLESATHDCHDLDESVALVLAVAIESAKVEHVRVKLPPPAKKPNPRVEVRPPESPARPWRGQIAAGGALALGLLPGPAIGVTLASSVEPPDFVPARLDLSVWFPSKADGERGGATFSAWQAGISLCPRVLASPLAISACGGLVAGEISAAGFGLEKNRRVGGALIDARAELLFALSEVRFSPWIALGAEVPFVRDRFVVDLGTDREELHRVSPLIFSARVGGLLAIP